MDNAQKAAIYDDCIRESDRLQRENSKIKSEYATMVPPEFQKVLDENNKKIAFLVTRLESLFN
jgi:hypothetical protein